MAPIPAGQGKRGPAATGQTPTTSIRLPSDISAGLAAWIEQQPAPRPKRSSAINFALRHWLAGMGLLKDREDADGAS